MRQKHSNKNLKKEKKSQRLEKEFFKTLSYSDIFEYPLTGDQLFLFLGEKMERSKFLQTAKKIPHAIMRNNIYYFLPHKKMLIEKRLQKEKISERKLVSLRKIVNLLRYIPTISFIGISGSLALLNSNKGSDSDIFIIAKTHTVWITRLFVYILLTVLNVKKDTKNSSHAICANMFVGEDSMLFPKGKRNMYIAHEIVQIQPLYNRQNVYEKFLTTNKWVIKYFPNMKLPKVGKTKKSFSLWVLFVPFEHFFRIVQIWYMQKKITRETIEKNFIAFHPIDYEKKILTRYNQKIQRYV